MKEYDISSKTGIRFKLDDKIYKVNFIPNIVEQDIYENMDKLKNNFNDIFGIKKDEWLRYKSWIECIFKHKKNDNPDFDPKEFFENIGNTEIINILLSLMNYISDRITAMSKGFIEDSNDGLPIDEKKNQENSLTTTTLPLS